jgi:pyrroline-5-carboxylate reductase
VVVLAVKPQVLPQVVEPLADALAGRLVVSIAAGVTLDTLETFMPTSRVVRVMPNLPLQVLSGATAVCPGASASADDGELVRRMFAALGSAQVMNEHQLDVAGAVTGCGPAYFALFVDDLVRAGVRAGLPAAGCREMVLNTMRGVAQQLLDSGEHPRVYMEKVTSPGGTTAAGLEAMEWQVFQACSEAVDAALERTRELAEG